MKLSFLLKNKQDQAMETQTRRSFVRNVTLGGAALTLTPSL
ncbi:MAG TPA: hypothetical protein DCG39_01575, partial [Opitutae bacterium]|nr:hypothetical protein [Opitutae bacterium]